MQRHISLDIYDYSGHALCNLYDSSTDISGQATEVFVHTERNGFKEIKFKLPSTCSTEKGEERNYRLDYLVNDYRLRLYEEKYDIINGVVANRTIEKDWFLVSESKVVHNKFSTDYDIRAGHISQLLNTKNLNLEFSDDEGNNTGTIKQIAETILEGTGWHLGNVVTFYEEDKFSRGQKVEKVRSFKAPAKTGAFKMMNDLCELFDAKPIYHGEGQYEEDGVIKTGRVCDIIPMNPFSEKLDEGLIPSDLNRDKVIELYYDKNITNISRTLNSDSLVTVFSAYGSYGDLNGMASLQNAEHAVLTFNSLTPNEYGFEYQQANYYFTVNKNTTNQKWSSLDFQSRSYIFNGTDIFEVYKEPKTNNTVIIEPNETVYEKNQLPYIMDFSYYKKIGLLTDEMFLKIAQTQKDLPAQYITVQEASLELSDIKEELSRTASAGNGFLMLDILNSDLDNGFTKLTLNKSVYSDGVIFRSDYDEAKRNYFSWNTATGIKDNGEAIAGKGAVIYIVRQGNPTKWEKAYVKAYGNLSTNYYRDSLGNIYTLHNEAHYDHKDYSPTGTYFPVTGNSSIVYIADDTRKSYAWVDTEYVEIQASGYFYGLNEFPEPDTITLWNENDFWQTGDKVYLFSADSISGVFGPREDSVLSNRKSIEEATKVSTETHPLYFVENDQAEPSHIACANSYGWYYRSYTNTFNFGKLYFCWGKYGDLGWNEVYVSTGDENPELVSPSAYRYYYSIKKMMLYILEDNKYRPVNKVLDERKITNAFAAVIEGCTNQEVLTKGMCEIYNYSDNLASLPVGNYAFKNEFNNYWLFTTDIIINTPNKIHYIPATKILWQDDDENHVLKAVEHSFRYLDFPNANELYDSVFVKGGYDNGAFLPEGNKQISNNIYVHDKTVYQFSLPSNSIIACFDTNQNLLGQYTTSPFTTPVHTSHVRVICNSVPTDSHYLRVQNYDKVLFSDNVQYRILSCAGAGERLGMSYLMDKFITLSHDAYEVKLPALRQAQQTIEDMRLELADMLGDMYREGFWQQNDYVGGDEDKLYLDALDNLKEISHPQADYSFTYLDLYGRDDNLGDDIKIDYPDIDIQYAAHLVDMDIDTNRWAYIDSIDKCYDQPWKTTIEVNTRLSMIGQQSFTDVLAKIAEVANETKAKQTIYDRADIIGSAGKIAADKLEGLIQANKLYILGGTSNWYTDEKGNIIFEAIDGNSAMMLTGRGLMISNSKDEFGDWEWRTALSGLGFNCDVIATGEFSAKHIIAGTITTDKLSSSVGQELEIGSNKALMLYATVDGTRPVDGLITKHPNEGDSYIKIAAKEGNNPAYIDIQSGGLVNVYGGSSVNVESGGFLNIKGGTLNLTSQGEINIKSGTKLDIQSGSEFLVNSPNFTIVKNSTTNEYDVTVKGNITTTGGKIAGFTIGSATGRDYMYAGGKTSLDSSGTGIYIGTDGINIANKFKFSTDGNTASLNVNASNITLGDLNQTLGTKLTTIDNNTTTFYCTTAQMTGKTYTKGNTWTCTDTINNKQYYYIYRCIQTRTNATAAQVTSDWVLTGTAITAGACLDINTTTGIINMVAANSINIAAGATISVAANKTLSLLAGNVSGANYSNPTGNGGTVLIGNSSAPFTIGSDYYTYSSSNKYVRAFIRNGVSSILDSSNTGVYIGTDGINLRSTNYYFKFDTKGDAGAEFKVNAAKVSLGNITLSTKLSDMESATTTAQTTADNAASAASSANTNANSRAKTWYCPSTGTGSITTKDYHVGDIWYETTSGYGYQYICKQVSSTKNNSSDWALVGTSITKGANLQIDAASGTINMAAANTITVAAGATVSITANKKLAFTTAGTIEIGNGVKPFTIGATTGTNGHAYIYNGVTSTGDTAHDGIYIGTDGITLGKGVFKVTTAGALTATSADITGKITATSGSFTGSITASAGQIAGWHIGSDYIGTGASAAASKVGVGTGTGDSSYVFWAGNSNNQANAAFSVTADGTVKATKATIQGKVTATSGEIAGWKIGVFTNGGGWFCNSSSGPNSATMGLQYSTSVDSYSMFFAGGTPGTSGTAKFKVTNQGYLTAKSGEVAGWNINSTSLGKNYSSSGYAYNVEMGKQGNYVGYWMGSGTASDAPLAMVMNTTSGMSYNDAYSVTAPAYYWAWWDPNASIWRYYRFDLQAMWNAHLFVGS